ncbi:MAG: tetratricopeptide repeat protein [Nitrospirae bacterium]|nr:tetratricopeptide repeat protein [Nitrospirota bacterium]
MMKKFSKNTVIPPYPPFTNPSIPTLLFTILLIANALFLSSCATAKKAEIKPAVIAEKKDLEEKKVRIAHPDAYYHFILGYKLEFEDVNAAIREYKTALEFDKDSPTLLTRLSALLARKGQLEEASAYAERAVQVDPEYFPALLLLGEIYANTEKADKGIAIFKKIIEINPYKIEAYLNLGLLYGSLKRYDEAEEIINKGISINPSSPLGYYYIGRIAFDRKKMGKAISYYKKALKVEPAFKPAYIGLMHI